MTRPPPTSTLFPTTPLSRPRRLVQRPAARARGEEWPRGGQHEQHDQRRPQKQEQQVRSEEHTSELQSQSNLVCRLLLEKKKTTEAALQTLTDNADKIIATVK